MQTAREQESILICTQCGHINPATNKFCGNCGNGLVSIFDAPPSKTVDNRKVVDPGLVTMPDLTTPPRPLSLNLRRRAPRWSRVRLLAPWRPNPGSEPRQVFREEPVSPISGPSFLGLSSDPTATGDYLLMEEEPRKGGAFRFLMFLAIIALIVVGALEWRAIRKMVAEQEREIAVVSNHRAGATRSKFRRDTSSYNRRATSCHDSGDDKPSRKHRLRHSTAASAGRDGSARCRPGAIATSAAASSPTGQQPPSLLLTNPRRLSRVLSLPRRIRRQLQAPPLSRRPRRRVPPQA